MRDRLAKTYHNIEIEYLDYLTNIAERAINDDIEDKIQKRQDFYVDKLLANGVFVPPCKVDDILYAPCQCCGRIVIVEYVVIAIQSSIRDEWIVRYKKIGSTVRRQCFISDIGKTIFLTKQEAKQALKGGAE